MVELSKPITLNTLLNKENVQNDCEISWQYFAYGFFNCEGTHKRSSLPSQVKYAKCFAKDGNTYLVDGAL